MVIEQTPENRKNLEKQVAGIANRAFGTGVKVNVCWNLENAKPVEMYSTEPTGIYASIFIPTPSVTNQELNMLRGHHLYYLEQAAHVQKNPDMDDMDMVPTDRLSDATEVETELIVEFGEDFFDS